MDFTRHHPFIVIRLLDPVMLERMLELPQVLEASSVCFEVV